MSWWRGVSLVAGREVRERARARSFRWVAALLMAGGVAIAALPQVLGGDDPGRIAVAGGPPGLAGALGEAGEAIGSPVRVSRAGDPVAARAAVDAGEVDAAVTGPPQGPFRVLVRRELGEELRAVVTAALSRAALRDGLVRAEVAPDVVSALLEPPPIEVSPVRDVGGRDPDAAGVALIVALLLYLALLLTGLQVATGVAEEKSSRISEVLLANLSPGRLLAGKVVGIGAVGLAQLALVALPVLVALVATGEPDVPGASAGAIAVSIAWFVAGFALFGVAFAATGALVARQEDVGSVTMPLSVLLIGGYFLAIAAGDADGGLLRALSVLPPFAPMAMPVRWATGAAGPGEMALAFALTAATVAAAAVAGARVYRRGLVRTGSRVALREALRAR